MSYTAFGGGQLVLIKDIPIKVLTPLDYQHAGFDIELSPDGGLWLTFESNNYNDQIEPALNALAPYIKSGDINFSGEDNSNWRFHFKDGTVEEQSGEIIYKTNKNRKFKVVYDFSNGEDKTEIEIGGNKNFDESVNELIRNFYIKVDGSGRSESQIAWIQEVM